MKNTAIPWNHGVMLICQKCGKAFDSQFSGDELRSNLKKSFKEQGLSPDIRVVASTCLDICEPNEQAVAFCPNNGPTTVMTFSGDNLQGQIEDFARRQLQNKK